MGRRQFQKFDYKAVPKQCDCDIALEFNLYSHILFVIGKIVCYIQVLRTLSRQFSSLNFEETFRNKMWLKIKKHVVLGRELGFL